MEYWLQPLQIKFLLFQSPILLIFGFLFPITPLLQYSSTPFFYSLSTSHIKVMIAVATMIEIMPVTTAEVAA